MSAPDEPRDTVLASALRPGEYLRATTSYGDHTVKHTVTTGLLPDGWRLKADQGNATAELVGHGNHLDAQAAADILKRVMDAEKEASR